MPGPSPVRPIVYSGRPLLLPGRCKGWRLHWVPSCSTARQCKRPRLLSSTLEHVAAWARDGVDQEEAVRILSNESVKVHTLARDYCGLPSRAGLIFGYGVVDLPEITRGLTALRSV